MREELERKVKAHMRKKKAFYTVAIIFISASLFLFLLSTKLHTSVAFWINLPSLALFMVLAITYISMFGFRKMEDALYDEEEEIEIAVAKLYEFKTRGMEERLDLDEQEKLELIELEKIKEKVLKS